MVLTGRVALLAIIGAGVVGVLVAGGISPGWALLAVNAALALAVALDALRAARPRDLGLVRSGDRKVRLGQVARVQLTVTNNGRRRWQGQLRDAWAPTANATIVDPTDAVRSDITAGPSGTAGPSDRTPIDLAPAMATRIDVAVQPSRRGDRPTDRVTLRALGPFGLAGRQRSVDVPWSVRTLPPFTSRRHLPSLLARLRDMDGRQAIAVRAQGTEFDSLREYVPGDDVRSIDWRATARAADVMVRTWRPERDRRVVLVLDTGRTSAVRIGDETRLDIHVDAGLLLAALAGHAGDRVDLIAHDRRTRLQVAGGSGPNLLPRLVDGIATLEPELTETDYRGLVSAVLSRVRKRALVVLFVALDRPAMEEGLLPALPALTARHTVVVAAVREPTPAPSANPPPGVRTSTTAGRFLLPVEGLPVEGVYLEAARARAEMGRAHLRDVLARMGVRVVSASPAEFAPRVSEAYLDMKAAGRL